MDLQPKASDIQLQLKQLEAKARHNFHRHLVVFSGDEQWVNEELVEHLAELRESHTLIVSDQCLDFEGEYIQAKQVKSYLGTEVERLIWNGFSGLNPDGLGAASGLLKGGGLLFLMLPELSKLKSYPDPDYLRMCSREDELPSYGTRFLQRMTLYFFNNTMSISAF